jgi:hypothetical protein
MSGFYEQERWPRAESNHRHADFQTLLDQGNTSAKYSASPRDCLVSKNTAHTLEPWGTAWQPMPVAQLQTAVDGGIGALARARSAWALRSLCCARACLA